MLADLDAQIRDQALLVGEKTEQLLIQSKEMSRLENNETPEGEVKNTRTHTHTPNKSNRMLFLSALVRPSVLL